MYVCVCVILCVHHNAFALVWVREQLIEVTLTFYHVGARDRTSVVRPGREAPSPAEPILSAQKWIS